MSKVNHNLRDKIKDIVVIVKQAITKAAAVKKNIPTHREPPSDPEVKAKYKEIKNYQAQIRICKKYADNMNIKIESMDDPNRLDRHADTIRKLKKDIKKLESHKKKLTIQLDNQIDTMHKLYSDPELKEKVTKMTDKIRGLKNKHEKMNEERKVLLEEQKKISDDYAKLVTKKKSLINKKIALKNNVPSKEFFKREHALEEEYNALKKRHEDFQQIMINKEIKQIDKVLEKETR